MSSQTLDFTFIAINDELGRATVAPIGQGAIRRYTQMWHHHPAGLVVSGVRCMPEVDYIHAVGGEVVFIDASDELRLGRLQARPRDDLSTLAEMRQREYAELNGETAEGKCGINSTIKICMTQSTLFLKRQGLTSYEAYRI